MHSLHATVLRKHSNAAGILEDDHTAGVLSLLGERADGIRLLRVTWRAALWKG